MPLECVKNNTMDSEIECHVARFRRVTWTIGHCERPDASGERNTAISLQVESPWGCGSASFANCGDCDWRDWLSSMDASYIGGKLFGRSTREPDYQKTISTIRGFINELRAENAITVSGANSLRRELSGMHAFDPRKSLDVQVEALVDFVRSNEKLRGFGSPLRTRDSARFTGFRRHAWAPFRDLLLAEFERAQQQEASLEDQDAELRSGDDDLVMAP